MRNLNEEDDFIRDINHSLASQVQEEMEEREETEKTMSEQKNGKKRKKKRYTFVKILLVILFVLLGSGVFLTLTPMGRKMLTRLAVEYIYSRMDQKPKKQAMGKPTKTPSNTTSSKAEEEQEEELKKGVITDNIDLSDMSDSFKNAVHEEGVYNVLLLGVEALFSDSDAHGRTDSIMIATINTNKNTLGLTSIMRDSYVKIPGYKDNRVNVAYSLGGEKLMYETIAENYGIRLDGSVTVGFEAFQKVIDELGGVEIEITEAEARYLNRTNYISDKSNRVLKPGKNLMNGNQALGYSRVRKVATLDGSNDDMGRTSRHRRVMAALFSKLKSSNPARMLGVMNTVIPLVKTDITKSNASSYLAELLEMVIDGVPLNTLRLPEDGAYKGLKVNGAWVIDIDWDKTKQSLFNFAFGSHDDWKKSDSKSATK